MQECVKLYNVTVVIKGSRDTFGDIPHRKLLELLADCDLKHDKIVCVEHNIQDSKTCYVKG